MASNTNKLKTRRRLRKRKMGKERKRINRSKGTTPVFPVHKENSRKNDSSGT